MPAGPGRDGQEGFCAIPAEWHGLNVLEESCFLSGATLFVIRISSSEISCCEPATQRNPTSASSL